MKNRLVALGILLASTVCHSASASMLQFDFDFSAPFRTEQNIEGATLSPVSGSPTVNVTVSGGLAGGTQAQNDNVDVIRSDWGLGTLNRNQPAGSDRSFLFRRIHVDGSGGSETIRLEFSQPTRIERIFFAFVGPFETFDLALNGVDVDVRSLLGTDEIYRLAPAGRIPGHVRFPKNLPLSKTWDLTAPGNGDAWNVEGLRVSVVPEPSTRTAFAGLGIAGLLSVIVVCRPARRRFAPARS